MNLHKQPGCWLRSSHSFKECVTAHWSSEFARKITGAKLYTEISDLGTMFLSGRVDGFHPINVGKLAIGEDCFVSCTPAGVMRMLEEYKIDIEGKHAVVIGRSNIVGKPLAQCLLNKNATVTICHSRTKNLGEITKQADILVAAIGKPKFVTADMVKEGAVVIDVGINRNEDGKLVGDVDYQNVESKAAYITPVPGGVGPMTIAMLMENVVKSVK